MLTQAFYAFPGPSVPKGRRGAWQSHGAMCFEVSQVLCLAKGFPVGLASFCEVALVFSRL